MTANPFFEIVELLEQRFNELKQRIDSLEEQHQTHLRELANNLGNLDSPYLTRGEAATVLRCSTSTVDHYRRTGKLPRAILGGDQGRKVLFLRDDVLKLRDL